MSNISEKADFIAGGVGGLGDIGLGIYNIVQGRKAAKQAREDLATAMSNRPDLSASTAFADAERNAYSKKMLNMQRQSLQRNLASGIQVLVLTLVYWLISTRYATSSAMGEQQAMNVQAQQQMQASLAGS